MPVVPAELVHVLCAPDVDQVERFRVDLAQLERSSRLAHVYLGLALLPFTVAALVDGLQWTDGLLAVELVALLALQRFHWLEQLQITRGLWRRSRAWMKEKRS